MIEELRIKNFRGFSSLELKDLKRVNLVVGENNAGKTSLLEAFFILSDPNRIGELPGIFRVVQGNSDLRFFRWLIKDKCVEKSGSLYAKDKIDEWQYDLTPPNAKGLDSKIVQNLLAIYKVSTLQLLGLRGNYRNCRVISINHRDPNNLVNLVGRVFRKSDGEDTLQRLLAKIDPRIKKVRIDPGDDGNQVIVDIGLSELVPVSQVGQGVYRLLSILAVIIGEQPEIVLIDEVENGLHHSVQKQIWTGLAEVAEKLDVQIIATTHSDECLHAAHNAFLDRETYDFSVIQLFRVPSGVQGRVLDREHIAASVAGHIDLR